MADNNTSKSPEDRGTTTIADTVVAKTVGIAAREVNGVHALGGTASQVIGTVRRRVGAGSDLTRGVSVEVGKTQTAIDLSIEVDYGEAIHKVAKKVREHVVSRVETTTGLDVVEVNISITDVYLEGSDDQDQDKDQEGDGGGRRGSSERSLG